MFGLYTDSRVIISVISDLSVHLRLFSSLSDQDGFETPDQTPPFLIDLLPRTVTI